MLIDGDGDVIYQQFKCAIRTRGLFLKILGTYAICDDTQYVHYLR